VVVHPVGVLGAERGGLEKEPRADLAPPAQMPGHDLQGVQHPFDVPVLLHQDVNRSHGGYLQFRRGPAPPVEAAAPGGLPQTPR